MTNHREPVVSAIDLSCADCKAGCALLDCVATALFPEQGCLDRAAIHTLMSTRSTSLKQQLGVPVSTDGARREHTRDDSVSRRLSSEHSDPAACASAALGAVRTLRADSFAQHCSEQRATDAVADYMNASLKRWMDELAVQ